MPYFQLLFPVELSLLALHTAVFAASVKLSQKPSRDRMFFALYSLQSFAELVAYLAQMTSTRLVAMDMIPASQMQNTFGTFVTTLLLFGYHCQRVAHFCSVVERYVALTRPERHNELRRPVTLAITLGFCVAMSSICALLYALDTKVFIQIAASYRIVPKSQAVHLIYSTFYACSHSVYVFVSFTMELHALSRIKRQHRHQQTSKSRQQHALIVFCLLTTLSQTLPFASWLAGFLSLSITGNSWIFDTHHTLYSYTFGFFYLDSAVFLLVKCDTLHSRLFRWMRGLCGTPTRIVPTSTVTTTSEQTQVG